MEELTYKNIREVRASLERLKQTKKKNRKNRRTQIRVETEIGSGESQSTGKNIYKSLKELIKVLKEVPEIEVLLL